MLLVAVRVVRHHIFALDDPIFLDLGSFLLNIELELRAELHDVVLLLLLAPVEICLLENREKVLPLLDQKNTAPQRRWNLHQRLKVVVEVLRDLAVGASD